MCVYMWEWVYSSKARSSRIVLRLQGVLSSRPSSTYDLLVESPIKWNLLQQDMPRV